LKNKKGEERKSNKNLADKAYNYIPVKKVGVGTFGVVYKVKNHCLKFLIL